MKIVSIDIESTGLNPETCQILSIGAVIEDTKRLTPMSILPKYYKRVTHDHYQGEIYALSLNKDLFTEILNNTDNLNIHVTNLVEDFKNWLYQYFSSEEKINVIGKNFSGFDKQFLNKLDGFSDIKLSHKVLDPAPFYVDWRKDKDLPSLDECLKRAGINKTVSHNALEDAMDVIKVMRPIYLDSVEYNLFLDDERVPSDAQEYTKWVYNDKEWLVVRNYEQFCEAIKQFGMPRIVSFDHDLKPNHIPPRYMWDNYELSKRWQDENLNVFSKTGRKCAEYLIGATGVLDKKPTGVWIHSQNPVGSDKIEKLFRSVNIPVRKWGKSSLEA